MSVPRPHFLLYSETVAGCDDGNPSDGQPQWKFVLKSVGGNDRFAAADTEQETRATRLELLAVVRGLEALDQPSRVTLLTRSRYVTRGIRRELNHWRERRWRWERFGKLVPIRDHDLWQRVDRALQFHQVECCAWGHDDEQLDHSGAPQADRNWSLSAALGTVFQGVLSPISAIWRPPFTRAA